MSIQHSFSTSNHSESLIVSEYQRIPLLFHQDIMEQEQKTFYLNHLESSSLSNFNEYESLQKKQENISQLNKLPKQSYVGGDEILELNQRYCEQKLKKQQDQRYSKLLQFSKFDQFKILVEEKIPVLEPKHAGLLIWNILVSYIIVIFFFEIPIFQAWGDKFWSEIMPISAIRIFIFFSYLIMIIDIGLQFITAFYQHGNLVTKKSKIANNYLKNNFVYDLVATIAFTFRISIDQTSLNLLYFLFYLKFPSLMKISFQFEEMILLKRRSRTAFSIVKSMLFMFFAIDLYGCYFFILGNWSIDQGYNSWLTTDGNFGKLQNQSVHQQFFFSFYFSLGAMSSTMGFGDITPMNIYECAFSLGGIIFALIVLALNMNSIFNVIEDFKQSSVKTFRARVAINRFMKTKKVPDQLSERVRQYLNEYWLEEGSRDSELESQTFAILAPELREELIFNSYGRFLQETEMFSSNFSRTFLKALSLQVQEISYSKGEGIFQDRDDEVVDDQSFYFILSGSVIIHPFLGCKSPEKTYLKKLKAGQHFGEWSFFTGMPRQASAKAYRYSSMHVIKRSAFLDTLSRFQDDYEHYCSMKDKLLMQNDLSVINSQCWTCGITSHMSTNCPLTHYRPSVEQVFVMIEFKVVNLDISDQNKQARKPFKRYNRSRWSTLITQTQLVKQTQIQRNNSLINNQRIPEQLKVRAQSSFAFQSGDQGSREALKKLQEIKQFQYECEQEQSIQYGYQPKQLQQSQSQQISQFQLKQHSYNSQASLQTINEDTNFEQDNQLAQQQQLNPLISEVETLEMQREISRFQIPIVKKGLLNFDEPHIFKRYKTSNNKSKYWSQSGELLPVLK